MSAVASQRADEPFAGLTAEGFVETDEPDRVDSQGGDGAQLLWQRINQRGHPVGGHHQVGMAVKGDADCQRFVLLGVRQRLANDLLVAQMHPVEDPDGHADLAASRFQLRRRVEDVHAASLALGGGPCDTELLTASGLGRRTKLFGWPRVGGSL